MSAPSRQGKTGPIPVTWDMDTTKYHTDTGGMRVSFRNERRRELMREHNLQSPRQWRRWLRRQKRITKAATEAT